MNTKQAELSQAQLNIYLIRHGKTLFNFTDKVQGFSNSPLTDEGVAQALVLGKNLSNVKFHTVFTSDLGRQQETAKHILSKNKNQVPDLIEINGFKEWNFGSFEGGENGDLMAGVLAQNGISVEGDDVVQIRKKFRDWIKVAGDRTFCNSVYKADPQKKSENYDDIIARGKAGMEQAISKTLNLYKGEDGAQANILIVSSGCIIRTILRTFAPKIYDGADILNCSVSLFKYANGKLTLEKFNDVTLS